VSPIGQILTQPLYTELSPDKAELDIRRARINLFENSKTDTTIGAGHNPYGHGISNSNEMSFLAMLQSSLSTNMTRPEMSAPQKPEDQPQSFNPQVSPYHDQDRDENQAGPREAYSTNPDNLSANSGDNLRNDPGKENKEPPSHTLEKNTKDGKNHTEPGAARKPEKFADDRPEQIAGKLNTPETKTEKINRLVAEELHKGFKNIRHDETAKNVLMKPETPTAITPNDLKELMAKGIKTTATKKETIVAELSKQNIPAEADGIKNPKGKIPVFDKLQDKQNLHPARDDKGAIQADLAHNAEKTDKPGKTSSLKNKGNAQPNGEDAVRNAERNVSRETIAIAAFDKKPGVNQNDGVSTKGLTADKGFAAEIIKSNLKSGLDSETPTGQQHAGYSTHGADRLNFMNKADDNLALRNNLQQQIDQMMQKAKVIIRENGNAQLTAKLNPRELGEISIKLTLLNGRLTGKVTVDNEFVQKELNDKLAEIFDELKSEGFSIDGFQVDVKSQEGQNQNFTDAAVETALRNFNGYGRSSNSESAAAIPGNFPADEFAAEFVKGEIYA